MLRTLMACVLSLAAVSTTAVAGDRFYFPGHVFAPPVVYVAPVVSWQPAYAVPTATMTFHDYGAQSVPVSKVSYSTEYYTPLVPTVSTVTYVAAPRVVPIGYYAPRTMVIAPAVYAAPVSYGYRGLRRHGRRFRGVEIEFERDGDIEIDYR